MMPIETLKGGRGKCQYCSEWYDNVSYHETWECEGNTNMTTNIKVAPIYINKEKVLEILDKYRNSVGVKYAIEEIEKL